MTEKQLRQKVANTAVSWSQHKNEDRYRQKVIDLYYAYKPLAHGNKMPDTDIWCAAFVCAVAIKADVTDILPLEFGCQEMVTCYQKTECWQGSTVYTPSVGDIVFYNDCGAGIIVDISGSKIKVIEGSKNGVISCRTMSSNGKYIQGYGTPDYAGKAIGPAAKAIRKLSAIGVIDSPHYWMRVIEAQKLRHLDALLLKASVKINKTGPKSSTPENGIGNLVAAGVVDTPDYWLANYRSLPHLGTLLCALGGAVNK